MNKDLTLLRRCMHGVFVSDRWNLAHVKPMLMKRTSVCQAAFLSTTETYAL